jgi:hypothetical protein
LNDKTNPASSVQLAAATWTATAEICVDVAPSVLAAGSTDCLSFYHSRPATAGTFTAQYTTVTEHDLPNSTAQATGAGYDDLTPADGMSSCLGDACPDVSAYDLRFTLDEVDCTTGEACYILEIKNAVGDDWALADQNYRIFFDGDLATVDTVTSLLPMAQYGSAIIDMNTKYSGQGQEAASPLDSIDNNLGFLDFNIVLTDKGNPASAVQLDTAAWTQVAKILVNVDPAVLADNSGSTCLSFYHSRPATAGTFTAQYTTVTENIIPGSTFGTTGADYGDLTPSSGSDACLGTRCGCPPPSCPPVNVTVIKAGE